MNGGRLHATRRGRGQGGVSAMGRGGWESRVTTLLAQGGYHGREGGGDGHWGRQRHITARICQHFHLQQTIGEVVQISAGCKQAPFICLLLQLKKNN